MRRGGEDRWADGGIEALYSARGNLILIPRRAEEAEKIAFRLLLFSISPYNFTRIWPFEKLLSPRLRGLSTPPESGQKSKFGNFLLSKSHRLFLKYHADWV
jgi:hypothetical protein